MTFEELIISDTFYDEHGCDYIKTGQWTAKCLTTEDGVVGFLDTESFDATQSVTKTTLVEHP